MTYHDEDWVAAVQGALTPDLLRAEYHKPNAHPHAGHCYVATEALWHLLGGYKSRWRPAFIRHEGSPHWFLRHADGTVLDPTADQFTSPPPYTLATGKAFLTKRPSKRARVVMARVLRVVNA